MHLLGLLNVTGFVASAGYGAIFILCLLQSCCVPTSSELTMGFAGVLAAQGKLSLPGVVLVGVLGEVIGAYIAWAVGRYAGRAAVDRFGRYILLSHRDLDKAEEWYRRHQRFGVFGSRLLPVIRNFVALPAGIAEVPLGRFGILTTGGSLLWDGAWTGIGYGVGSHWHTIAKAFGDVGYVLGALAVVAVAFAAVHRYRSYKEATSGGGGASSVAGSTGASSSGTRPSGRLLRSELDADGRRPRPAGSPHPDAAEVASPWPPGAAHASRATLRTAGGMRTGAVRWVASSSGRPLARTAQASLDDDGDRWVSGSSRRHVASAPVPRPRTGRHVPRNSGRRARSAQAAGELPLVGRMMPSPLAAKVPEVIFAFWMVKILTTAGGEATSDYLKIYGNIKGGAVEVGLFAAGLLLQFGTRRYRAFAYWFLAFAIAIFGTGVSDFLHLDAHIPYAGTSLLWAGVLAGVLWLWHRSEGTLSIHSITTQRREAFYWTTVFATFALGTALGDLTAFSLHLGFFASVLLFLGIILLPAVAWWRFGLNGVAAFWMSYVVTRPLGASVADYISKPHSLSGIAFGDLPTTVVFAVAVFLLVAYLAVTRADVQRPATEPPLRADAAARYRRYTTEPELGPELELE